MVVVTVCKESMFVVEWVRVCVSVCVYECVCVCWH